MRIDARVAIVTGAARGIGRAVAERLSAEGCAVALWDIDESVHETAAAIGEGGRPTLASTFDVADSAGVRAAADVVRATWGRVDVLVNNAGWDRFGWFIESSEEHWDRVIAVNYRGVLNTCRYLANDIIEHGRQGRIIQVASDTAKIGGPLEAVYSGAKGAVVSFSRALARELAPTGVTVNVVHPGSTDTALFRAGAAAIESNPAFKAFFPGDLVASQIARIPTGRLGLPSDVANGVAFFADVRSEHVTGQVLSVDGGETMY